MSEQQQKTFQTAQHTPLSMTELLSATEAGDGFFETVNCVKFTHVEVLGMVSRVITKDESSSVLLTATLETGEKPSSIFVGGKFVDEDVKAIMESLVEHSFIIVRGKISIYTKEGETRMSINANQVIELPGDGNDVETRNYWYHALLHSRIKNRYPLIKDGELAPLLSDIGMTVTQMPDDERLVTVPSTIVPARTTETVVAERPVTKTSVESLPARSPEIPREIQKKVEAKKSSSGKPDDDVSVDQIVNLIVRDAGLDIEEVRNRVKEIADELGDLITETGAAFSLAETLSVDVSGLKPGAKPVTKPVAKPAAKPVATKPVAKPVSKVKPAASKETKKGEILSLIKDLATSSGGKTTVDAVYAAVKSKFSIDDNVTQDVVLQLYTDGKVEIDGENVTVT